MDDGPARTLSETGGRFLVTRLVASRARRWRYLIEGTSQSITVSSRKHAVQEPPSIVLAITLADQRSDNRRQCHGIREEYKNSAMDESRSYIWHGAQIGNYKKQRSDQKGTMHGYSRTTRITERVLGKRRERRL